MKIHLQVLLAAAAALCFTGCATNSIEKTWKSPAYQQGPVAKVAVLGVDERGLVRQGFENRFVRDFQARGQASLATFELLGLDEIKSDKVKAASRLREAGADSVLIVRLVDRASYDRQVRATEARYVESVTGMQNYYGWYDYYEVAYTDIGTVWSSSEQKIYLDSSLFDLATGQRLWSALTLTTLKDRTDRLAAVDELVAQVVQAARKAGVTR
jgi:hypothetical protein